jgi:biotin synthase
MQPLALHLANSIFLGDYLTSEGQAGRADLEMIADAGFDVEGADTTTLPEHRAGAPVVAGTGCGSHGGGSHHEGGGCDPCGSESGGEGGGRGTEGRAAPGAARTDLVAVRRRGAGTDLAPNA